jgi:catechol 2,3-dioxygenase
MTITRRGALRLAGVVSAAAALQGALLAEGVTAAMAAPALPFAVTTPVHVDQAALRVRDLKSMTAYYQTMLGLEIIEQDDVSGDRIVLGAGGSPLLHLVQAKDAAFETPGSAGLFHIAYLMPDRGDLARWLVHVAQRQFPITGFADHSVSEAVYLTDPEGNGVEVYWDRPHEMWTWDGEVVTMGTSPLDVDDIVANTDISRDTYTKAPANLRIGHIHLRVGEIGKARAFYGDLIGLSSTQGSRDDSGFFSSGHYHHHLAFNTWQSAGAGMRAETETGLDWFSLEYAQKSDLLALKEKLKQASVSFTRAVDHIDILDPWGTNVRLTGL